METMARRAKKRSSGPATTDPGLERGQRPGRGVPYRPLIMKKSCPAARAKIFARRAKIFAARARARARRARALTRARVNARAR